MLVIAQHTNITDPAAFWAKAQSVVGATPAGTSVLSVFPSQDGKTGPVSGKLEAQINFNNSLTVPQRVWPLIFAMK